MLEDLLSLQMMVQLCMMIILRKAAAQMEVVVKSILVGDLSHLLDHQIGLDVRMYITIVFKLTLYRIPDAFTYVPLIAVIGISLQYSRTYGLVVA